jgi:hypothetical protein
MTTHIGLNPLPSTNLGQRGGLEPPSGAHRRVNQRGVRTPLPHHGGCQLVHVPLGFVHDERIYAVVMT